jgi:hypothetical protein
MSDPIDIESQAIVQPENNESQIIDSIDLNKIGPYMAIHAHAPIKRMAPKIRRNQLCEHEGKKFKHCCGKEGINFCRKSYKDFLNKMIEESKKIKEPIKNKTDES